MRDGTFPENAMADLPLDKAFGIADDIRMSVLHSLADFSPERVDDLAEYLSQDKKIDRASVIKVLDWATIIRLVAQQGDLVEIDPFLQERLRKRASH